MLYPGVFLLRTQLSRKLPLLPEGMWRWWPPAQGYERFASSFFLNRCFSSLLFNLLFRLLGRVTNSIFFWWLCTTKDQCKKCFFLQTHIKVCNTWLSPFLPEDPKAMMRWVWGPLKSAKSALKDHSRVQDQDKEIAGRNERWYSFYSMRDFIFYKLSSWLFWKTSKKCFKKYFWTI